MSLGILAGHLPWNLKHCQKDQKGRYMHVYAVYTIKYCTCSFMPISILCCLSFGGLGLLPTLWRSSSCVVVLVFVFWRSGACAHPAADSLPLRGCGCLLSYGFLCGFCSWFVSSWWRSRGFCPPWGVFLLVVLAGVCCLVLWGFFLPWAVSVPFCGCV